MGTCTSNKNSEAVGARGEGNGSFLSKNNAGDSDRDGRLGNLFLNGLTLFFLSNGVR